MQVVYTGTDGALYAWERERRTAARLTWPWEEAAPGRPPVGLQYGWPTCSRDGRRILTLARRGTDRHFVYVVDANGIGRLE